MPSTSQKPAPFHSEHIGSFKRPDSLIKKREEFTKGLCTAEDLRAAENAAIKEVIQLQREYGIKSLTDGEFRRHFFFEGVFEKLEGMKFVQGAPGHIFMDYLPDIMIFKQMGLKNLDTFLCEGKLKRVKPFYVEDFKVMKSFTNQDEHSSIKITMCPPSWFHLRHGEYTYSKSVYKNDEEYFADLIVAYREEIAELYAAGCRNIQFDDPTFAFFCSEYMINGMEERKLDHEALMDSYIRMYNKILDDRPLDLNVGVHMCRGNYMGMHFSEGGYERIAAKLFNDLNMNCFYLEYDTERAGDFEPLRFLPKGKKVVLGLISTKLSKLEDPAELRNRVVDAAFKIADGTQKRSFEEALDQICISPQCGFASTVEGNPITMEDVKEKLKLLVGASQSIWRPLAPMASA